MTEEKQDTKSPIEKMAQISEQDVIKNLLKNLPPLDEVAVELPSKNKFYALEDPAKPVTVRPMTFDDEKSMMSNKNINVDILNNLLGRCVSNVKVDQLLQMDKLFLIMKLREISYGDEYNATINCTSCKRDSHITFTLHDLPVTYLEDDATNPIEVYLPVLKKTAKVRRPRVADESYFNNAEYALENLWRFVEEIEGCAQATVISKVIPKLPLKDAHLLINALSSNQYGIDTEVRFVCDYCGQNEVMELPITADFFTEN